MFTIRYSKAATQALMRMPRNTAEIIQGKLIELATDPHALRANVRALMGRSEMRLRVGNWRVLYTIDDASETIDVIVIAPRESVYE